MIRGNPVIYDRMRQLCVRRARACVENNGGHFEHLL